jgi:hypothetical protein
MKFLKTIKIALTPKIIVCILFVAATCSLLMFQSIPISGETSKTLLKMLFFPIALLIYNISVMVIRIGLVKIYAQKQSR